MKKILSLMMALMMLLTPVFAMGASSEEYGQYADPNGLYSFSYPSDWMMISEDTFDALWQLAEQQADESFKATMESVKPQIKEMGMIFLMSSDLVSNINLTRQEVAGADANTLLALSSQLEAGLTAALDGCEIVAESELLDIGNERQALIMQYSYPLQGMQLYGVQAYVGTGDALYLFTLTTTLEQLESAAETLGFVLGSSQLK